MEPGITIFTSQGFPPVLTTLWQVPQRTAVVLAVMGPGFVSTSQHNISSRNMMVVQPGRRGRFLTDLVRLMKFPLLHIRRQTMFVSALASTSDLAHSGTSIILVLF